MSLIVTIVILLILAGVSIRSLTGSKGLINQAKETKTAAEMKDIEEQIELVLVKAELKSNNVTMESVIKQLINAGIIDDESQVDQDTGDITFGDYVLEEKLADYVITPEEKYYGNKNTVVTNPTYFTFTVDEAAGTATITGVKDEYAVKTYYNGEATNYTAVIKDGENYVTDVVIPYEYVDENGKKYVVTGIGDSAFGLKNSSDWDSVLSNVDYTFTSFVLPNTITKIGASAFRGCSNLKSINIPSALVSIGEYTFYECGGIPVGINIPLVTQIGNRAFGKCTHLKSVNLGDGLTSIGIAAFAHCTSLSDINIPNSVTAIGDSAFYYCTSLTSIEIPSSVTKIRNSAFSGCSSLTSVNIPSTVISIDNFAFSECTSLTSIKIPDSVTTIGGSAFQNCTSLNNIEIPNSITSISASTFYKCTSLSNIEIPRSVTSIGASAFFNCIGLKSIEIPSSITQIGNCAFQGCSGLNKIYIPKSVTSMGSTVFAYWLKSQTINCEFKEEEKPEGWDATWDYYNPISTRQARA